MVENSFHDFLKKNDFLFAGWSIIAGILFLILDLYIRALERQEEWKIINVTNTMNEQLSRLTDTQVLLFPWIISLLFSIFLLLSTLIFIESWIKMDKIQKHTDRRTSLINSIYYYVFNIMFLIFIILLFIFMATIFWSTFAIILLFTEIGIFAIVLGYVRFSQIREPPKGMVNGNP